MFKNLKLGAKIGLGFTIVIALAIIIGALAVWNMKSVQTESMILAKEYVPEVEVSNNIERNSLMTMYNMRGYGLSEEQAYLDEGRKYLEKVNEYLAEARKLADESEHLEQLKKDVPELTASVAEYADLVDQTEKLNLELEAIRGQMDVSAGKYMENCAEFLAGQNEKFKDEMKSGAALDKQNERLDKITIVNDIIDLGNDTRVKNFKSQSTRDPGLMKAGIANFDKIEQKLEELTQITYLKEDLQRIDDTRAAGLAYKSEMGKFLAAWEDLQELNKSRTDVAETVLQGAQETAHAGITNTSSRADNAVATLSISSTIVAIGLVVATILGIVIAVFITMSITGPINKIITGLSDGAEQVSSASGQVSSASQSLAEGAAEQASSLEEVSSSLEEMASMTRQNAENADQANTLAKDARLASQTGNEATQRMIGAMKQISDSAGETQKIIKTIDEIAFQTNLLALNAAVEAARAGEAGKGFAVVAEEVRNLAQRAGEAARNTAEMIEESVTNTNNGSKIADDMAKALTEITEGTGKASDLVAEIAAASKEQAQGIDQVNTAVGQMDKVTQQNASNAEETASASEELNSQAEQMTDVVGDLIKLVGGAEGAMQIRTANKSHVSNMQRHHLNLSKIQNKGKKDGNNSKAFKKEASSSGHRSNNIIPLDEDEDFKEF